MAQWDKIITDSNINDHNTNIVKKDKATTVWLGNTNATGQSLFQDIGDFYGETIVYGVGTSFEQGRVYQYGSTGWAQANNDEPEDGNKLLVVATANTSGNSLPFSGLLLKGIVRVSPLEGSPVMGQVVYLGQDGKITGTAPTATGSIVRPVGYCINQYMNIVFFDPDKTWVELS